MSKTDKVKILLVQTMNMNLGDSAIGDNDEFLIRKALGDREADIFRYSIASRDFRQVQYMDAVVFVGGILKITNEKFWMYIPELIEEADRYGVPVFMCAIGVEPSDLSDERTQRLIEAVNLPCVKMISIRDDINTFRREYLRSESKAKVVPVIDPAIWSAQTYGIEVHGKVKEVRRIGIGITRSKLTADYGHAEVDAAWQLEFWTDVIEELEKRGLDWEVFTNGDMNDEAFAREVLEQVGHGAKAMVPRTAEDLAHILDGYDGVIAGRMHSNIISYALGIPSVGFIWNRKLDAWSRKIGHRERFFRMGEMNAGMMVRTVLRAMKDKNKPSRKMQKVVYKPIQEFVRKYVTARSKEDLLELKEPQKHLFAPALGGLDFRWRSTNSREAFEYSLEHGFRKFQVDLRMTMDETLVCINRWHRSTYALMGVPFDPKKDFQPALTTEAFENALYYDRFHPLSFAQLAQLWAAQPDKENLTFILSVGRPSEENADKLYDTIISTIREYGLPEENVILRLERMKDIEYFRTKDSRIQVMYFWTGRRSEEKPDLSEENLAKLKKCKEKKVNWYGVLSENWDEACAAQCKGYPVKVCVFSYGGVVNAMNAVKNGAELAGSHLYPIDYVNRLQKK